jgi:hypothetical protein
MPRHVRYVPPEHTVVVKGLLREERSTVEAFVAKFTDPLGVAVHADHMDKKRDRLVLYCNFDSPLKAANALHGLSQFVLQTIPKISEFHQVLAVLWRVLVLEGKRMLLVLRALPGRVNLAFCACAGH